MHGIKAYVKPVLKCDTLFDVALRADLRTAIVSTANDSSSSVIFLERQMDYYIIRRWRRSTATRRSSCWRATGTDLIVVYNPTTTPT